MSDNILYAFFFLLLSKGKLFRYVWLSTQPENMSIALIVFLVNPTLVFEQYTVF